MLAGDVVAGRYRIVGFLARGGMGEVYEAEDTALRGERVALKMLRREIAGDERALRRFRREIQLARRVTHPNVCRIFDLGIHQPDDGAAPLAFLTMELLRGETLAAVIAREAPMAPARALGIVEQLAAGLDAAHAAGVIHRDLKGSNVMLAGGRVVMTDFGLARPDDEESTAARPGGVLLGTPTHVAPEQLEARPVSGAADLYALGVVLYEMMTGKLPFHGDSPLATAALRLVEEPPPPSRARPELDPAWDAAILRCLARDPAARFGSGAELLRALRPRPRRGRRWVAPALAALVAAGALAAVLVARSPAAAPPRPSVSVLGLRNLSPAPGAEWLSTAFSEMLATELAGGDRLRVVPGEEVARMKVELALPATDSLGGETLRRVRANLGSDFVVLGSYFEGGAAGPVRFDVRLQDARSGEVLAAVSESGTTAELPEVVARVGGRLRARLGVDDAPAAATTRALLPASPRAARAYSEGLDHLRRYDAPGARVRLAEAVALEPGFAPARAALAEAWSRLGNERAAAAEALAALERAGDLPREQRMLIEARRWQTAREWGKAIELYRTLAEFFPDKLEYGCALAEAQTAAGDGRAALETVARLRRLPPPLGDDPRVDLAEAAAGEAIADFRLARTAARAASEKGLARGRQLVAARGRFAEAWASYNLGDLDRALLLAAEAQALARKAGDPISEARAFSTIAAAHAQRGRWTRAGESFAAAARILREAEYRWQLGDALGDQAQAAISRGDLARARALTAEALALGRETGNRTVVATELQHAGWIQLLDGDVAAARASLDEAAGIFEALGERRMLAWVELWRGRAARDAGDATTAERHLRRSLELREALGLELFAAESRLWLAALTSDAGAHERAAALLAQAQAVFLRERAVDLATLAEVERSRQVDDAARAGEAVARAVAFAAGGEDPDVRLQVDLAAARVLALRGATAQARARLEAALAAARRAGLVVRALEAELALADVARSPARRREAQAEAERRGILRLAH